MGGLLAMEDTSEVEWCLGCRRKGGSPLAISHAGFTGF
jgi:hypothetical protein